MQFSKVFTQPVVYMGNEYWCDPNLVIRLDGDENDGRTFAEVYSLTQIDIDAINVLGKWSQVREARDAELKASDWTQGADVPDSIKQPWAVYRAALRDLPQAYEEPDNVVFPQKPE